MKTFAELEEIRKKKLAELILRKGGTPAEGGYKRHVLCCAGTGCTSSGSAKIIEEFENQIKANGIENEVQVVKTGCFGLCALGPIVIVYPEGSFYSRITADNVKEIVEQHLVKGEVVTKYLYDETIDGDTIKGLYDVTFYSKQLRVALRNCGAINPECIDEYIAFDGYKALEKVLTSMTPAEV